ncbi:hypothetical protein TR51_10430 [Kitasatospora griseola]|uniref:HIRAN domain-containing protein n=1 Tax=Kitasatospora griseola TaxID=2064 RepID=A0A0D0Q119_KITGR|nr:HIRAN domain-containing protein [Kitasatospora griseola]KIQ64638.1 hypothetical protein TR51_10430 [Kitasatospora griseola]
MDGDGISVEFDGSFLRVRPTNVIERDRFGTGDLVVPVAEIASVSIKAPRLMVDGHLDVSTCGGQTYQLHFTRRQRSGFDSLHRRVLGTIGSASAVLSPEPAPPNSVAQSTVIPAEPLSRQRIGTPWQLHPAGHFRQSVVGESYHSDQLERISGPEAAGEKQLVAELRREPRNPHDRDAIQVLIDGGLVGYVPKEDAPDYQRELKAVESWGYAAQCPARLWWRREQHELVASVSLDLAEPGRIVSIVPRPVGELVLPPSRWFQVGGEAEHMDMLVPLLDRAYFPGRAFAYALLELVDRMGPRSVIPIVVVRIGGGAVGVLSR